MVFVGQTRELGSCRWSDFGRGQGSEVTSEYMVFVLLFYNAALFTLVNYEDMEVDSSQFSRKTSKTLRENCMSANHTQFWSLRFIRIDLYVSFMMKTNTWTQIDKV